MISLAVAVFGGTFDPVHLGHIRMAEYTLDVLGMDKLIVLPNGNPPHKADKDKTSFEHRYNMLMSAFKNMQNVEISDFEADTSKHSYSVDTMRYFRKKYNDKTFFVMGADSLLTIDKWYKYEELLSENSFIVFKRKGEGNLQEVADKYKTLYGTEIRIADMPPEDVSSTEIRRDIYTFSDSLAEVRDYIIANGLYTGMDDIVDYLRKTLEKSRFEHTIGVAHTARHLANLYGCDGDKACFAGLLHDCAKGYSREKLAEKLGHYSVELSAVEKESPQLWHSFVGAFEAEKLFNADKDVFDAIYYHTTGKKDMSTLCAIVYLADAIEPGRKYPGVEKLRELAEKSLDCAVTEYTKISVEFVESRGLRVHPDTLALLNRR